MITLTAENIDGEIQRRADLIAQIGPSIQGLSGLELLAALKRDRVGAGPYPDVTLFEAANRIMTDLVILYGVRWLLEEEHFPFYAYDVELGHGNENQFDIMAQNERERLVGEAFNVAPSFFQVKKSAMLKKLRGKAAGARYRIILVNQDAVKDAYAPKVEVGESYVVVNVSTAICRVLPEPVEE